MGKLAVYKYFSFVLLIITILLSLFTLIGLFAGNANPAQATALAMIVYIMPLLIIGNIVIFPFWLFRRHKFWAVIPIFTILCSLPYIGTIYQIQIFQPDEDNRPICKIATYNVAVFGREISGFKARDILSEMKRQEIDIMCIQEYMEHIGDKNNNEIYKSYFPYMVKGRDDMAIFSRRFPIKRSEIIDFGPTNNSGMWADIEMNGKTIRIFNVHLETTGFNRTMHKVAKMEMRGNRVEENAIIAAIYGNYTRGMVVRAVQAKIVAEEIRKSPYPVILCGDFNDVPYSYTYNVMKGDLVDGFKECGKGYMSTFRGKKNVRIDYIFHSPSLSGKKYYTQDLNYSDHNPVYMHLSY